MRNLRFLLLLCLISMLMGPAAFAAIPPGKADALIARAASQGELRLIVQLAAMDQPFGQLAPAARQLRMQQISTLQSTFLSQARRPGLRELRRFSTIPFLLLKADAQAIDALARMPQVISILEDIPEAPSLASSLPVIGATAAWVAGYDGAGQVVVVLDTGVDTSHPFFPPTKLLAEACFSTTDAGSNSTSLCPGGASSSTAAGSGQDCPANVSGCDHGTHVAGIAVGDNGTGPNLGVARGAGMIPIQVFSRFSSGPNCGGLLSACSFQSDQIAALEHVLALSQSFNIAAVNMSLGGAVYSNQEECDDKNPARKAAIDNLRSVGIATIVASGNSSSRSGISQPGCISTAISVGNTTDADQIAPSSNVAGFLDLLAPGSDIVSSVPEGGLLAKSGTSMSAPHVSGAWAVLRQAQPLASIDEILFALRSTGTVVNDQRSGSSVTDMRRINIDLALSVLAVPKPEIASSPVPGSILDLGDVAVSAMGTEFDLAVTNNGDAELTLSCAISGAQASHFALIACPAALAGSTSADISLRCDPQAMGEFSAALSITSNDISDPTLNYTLQCTGLGVEIVTLPVADSTLAFGSVLVNTNSAELSVQVSNTGNQPLNLACERVGQDFARFAIMACPGSVAGGGQALVRIRCEPDSHSSFSASLHISSNDTDEALLSFPLSCSGVAPEINPDPPASSLLDFGTVYVAESSTPVAINIGNSGSAGLNISCAVQGTHASSFQVVQCPASISPAQSAPIQLQCSPTKAGTRLAELRINSDDADDAELLFSLTCLAQWPPGTIFNDDFEVD